MAADLDEGREAVLGFGEALHLLAQLLIDQLQVVTVELHRVWWGDGRLWPTPEDRVNLCQNDLWFARLRNEVAHTAALGERARFPFMIGRRVENDRGGGHLRHGAHLADEFVAIHGCHEDVADDQVGPSALHECERLPTVCRLEHDMPVIPQQRDEVLPIGGAILGDQDGRHGISGRSQDGSHTPFDLGDESLRNDRVRDMNALDRKSEAIGKGRRVDIVGRAANARLEALASLVAFDIDYR
jgi:hypothetical protein